MAPPTNAKTDIRSNRLRIKEAFEVMADAAKQVPGSNETGAASRELEPRVEQRTQALVKANEALQASEERYRSIVEGADDFAIVTLNQAGLITSWNVGAERLLGFTEAEALGRPGEIFFTPEDRELGAAAHEMEQAQRTGRASDERWHMRKDGSRFWGSGLMMRLGSEGYLKIFRDRTAEHKAEAALRASEARYRTLFDSIESGFCVVDVKLDSPDGRIDYRVVEANPAFERHTGLVGAQGRWLREFAPALEEKWYATYGRIARTGVAERFEEGSALLGRWFDVYAFRIGAPEDHRVAILFNDISARRNMEERLRELNETLEQQVAERTSERDRMWDTSPELMLIIDFEGVFRRVNPAWTSVLGYQPEELIGHHVNEFVDPEDHHQTTDAYELAGRGARLTIDNRYRHKNGSIRWISWVAAPAGLMIYATGRDVTDERARQAALEAAQEALRQANKMEAVGQLTGGIAHDFNNMLAVVIGSLDLLARRVGGEDARAKRHIEVAANSAKRAALLTQRLLAFSRQQPLSPEPIVVNKLVANMSELIRRSIGAHVRLETALASGLWRTQVDPNQLESALLNLAVNARDAMPEGGRLTIETQNAHVDAHYAAANSVPVGQYVMVAVSDSGAGMPREVIAKAFDPFFTTKPVGKGTGLGLSQVYGFVKQSGGHVKIYSELDHGTTVKIYLPRLLGAPEKKVEETNTGNSPLGQGQEIILVVDDEPEVREFTVEALTYLGYRVLEADNAAAALRLLETHREVALLFTDVVMPDGNGHALAKEARRRHSGLKVLFTTGYTRNAVVHNGMLSADVHLIGKPFSVDELAVKLREVLDLESS